MNNFKELGIADELLAALEQKGFEEPTPIQQQAIPILLSSDQNVVGQAQTGTGKTAAFGIPIIQNSTERSENIQALILTPTRELAIQVAEELNSLKGNKKLTIIPVYGGQSIQQQLSRLKKGVDVIVATPGRLIDHINRKTVKINQLRYLVLDEADEMLNMGFWDEVEEIMKHSNPERQVLLFSATMPEKIKQLARRHMGDFQTIAVKKDELSTPLTDQIYFEVKKNDKFDALCRIIDVEIEFYGVIFCRTKVDTDEVALKLNERGYGAEALHGDISQQQREKILRQFREKKINILVATDVAARGIDVADLTHVINYSLPQDPEAYVHRIGRTGRAGKQGTAITFITPSEFRRLSFIQKVAKADIRKGQLPGTKEVLEMKFEKIKDKIAQVIDKKESNNFHPLVNDLMENYETSELLAAVMKLAFKSDLEVSPLRKVKEKDSRKERNISVDKRGKTRLFIALGKKDGISPKKLINLIKQEVKMDEKQIGDIDIFDKFSFVNLPFNEAELVLATLNRKFGGTRPMVEKAKGK